MLPREAPELAAPAGAQRGAAPLVLHLRSSCGFYGAEGVIQSLVHHYRGESVTVCLADQRDTHTELIDRLAGEGYATEALPSCGAFDRTVPFRFAEMVRRLRPDVIHTHDYKSDAIATLARIISREVRGLPLIATMHGVVRTTGALRRYERIDARLLRRYDRVVAVSAGTAQIARDGYGVPPERVILIPNGVDTELFRPGTDRAGARGVLGLSTEGWLIGAVGRLSEEKGQTVLLEALAAMGEAAREARVALVGDGPMAGALKERAAALHLSDRVHFLGRWDEMARVYPAFDVLALPSLGEGLPLTVLEASACGVPVVASDVGDVARVLPDGVAGLIVPPGDPRALSAALLRLRADPCLSEALAEEARARVVARHSARAMADAYEGVYRAVRAGKRAAR